MPLSLHPIERGNAFIVFLNDAYVGEVYRSDRGWKGIGIRGTVGQKKNPIQAASRLIAVCKKRMPSWPAHFA